MTDFTALPNGRVLLSGLTLTPERLRSGTKAAVSLRLLRAILTAAIAGLPFDEAFYLAAYADVREAHTDGRIKNLHEHFIEDGYLEGRLGTNPEVDEEFYREAYPDVARALDSGKVASALDHYITAGCFEGRSANQVEMESVKPWLELLQPP